MKLFMRNQKSCYLNKKKNGKKKVIYFFHIFIKTFFKWFTNVVKPIRGYLFYKSINIYYEWTIYIFNKL